MAAKAVAPSLAELVPFIVQVNAAGDGWSYEAVALEPETEEWRPLTDDEEGVLRGALEAASERRE